MEYRYTAIVLGKVDVGETDRLYIFMTREAGKIVAKGVGTRKSCAKLSGHLETGNLVSLVVMKRKGMGRIASALCERAFLGSEVSYECLKEILEVIFLFSRVVEEGERDEALFMLLKNVLEVIVSLDREGRQDRFSVVTLGFLFGFLHHLGGAPNIRSCVVCGNTSFYTEKIGISAQSGGVLCNKCFSDDRYAQGLSEDVYKLLKIFSRNSLGSLPKIRLTTQQVQSARMVLQLFYNRLLQ